MVPWLGDEYPETTKNFPKIVITPKSGETTKTVFFLHGVTLFAKQFSALFTGSDSPVDNATTKVVLLDSPEREVQGCSTDKAAAEAVCDKINIPFMCNCNGPIKSWFQTQDKIPWNLTKLSNEVMQSKIENELYSEMKLRNGSAKDIFLGGYSQGGYMMYPVALGFDHKLGGIFHIATDQNPPIRRGCKKNQETPYLFYHGANDFVVDFTQSIDHANSACLFERQKVQVNIDPKAGHTSEPETTDAAQLIGTLPASAPAAIKKFFSEAPNVTRMPKPTDLTTPESCNSDANYDKKFECLEDRYDEKAENGFKPSNAKPAAPEKKPDTGNKTKKASGMVNIWAVLAILMTAIFSH